MHEPADGPKPATQWPVGHLGWAFTGLAEFEGRAGSYLAAGHACGERLVFVADDPTPGRWPKDLVERGALLVRSTAEVYGPEQIVDVASARATFEGELEEALSLGYTGLRVIADGTSLAAGPERLEALVRWEGEADVMIQEKPISGLCAFDRARTDAGSLVTLMSLHRAGPPPLFGGRRPFAASERGGRP